MANERNRALDLIEMIPEKTNPSHYHKPYVQQRHVKDRMTKWFAVLLIAVAVDAFAPPLSRVGLTTRVYSEVEEPVSAPQTASPPPIFTPRSQLGSSIDQDGKSNIWAVEAKTSVDSTDKSGSQIAAVGVGTFLTVLSNSPHRRRPRIRPHRILLPLHQRRTINPFIHPSFQQRNSLRRAGGPPSRYPVVQSLRFVSFLSGGSTIIHYFIFFTYDSQTL